jgi:hypothetical protein
VRSTEVHYDERGRLEAKPRRKTLRIVLIVLAVVLAWLIVYTIVNIGGTSDLIQTR